MPNLVAVEHFRNLIAQEAYDNLYNPLGRPADYPIRDLKTNLRTWTRSQGILSYQYIRKVNSEPFKEGEIIPVEFIMGSEIQPLNNPKILRVRGIKMRFAGFSELTPTNPEVRKQFFDVWQAGREMDADLVLSDYNLQDLRQQNDWRIEAQQEILNELINILDSNPHASEAWRCTSCKLWKVQPLTPIPACLCLRIRSTCCAICATGFYVLDGMVNT